MNTLIHNARPTETLRDVPVFADVPAEALTADSGPVWAECDDAGVPIRGGLGDSFHRDAGSAAGSHPFDASGMFLIAPFTDIHCHGAGGYAYEDADSLPTSLSVHRDHGTGRALASFVANPLDELEDSFRRVVRGHHDRRGRPRWSSLGGHPCRGSVAFARAQGGAPAGLPSTGNARPGQASGGCGRRLPASGDAGP
jgi:N-acetylglucosamine-6-phosphate deacetylase